MNFKCQLGITSATLCLCLLAIFAPKRIELPIEVGNPSIAGNASYFKAVRETVDEVDGFYDVIGHGGPRHMAVIDDVPLDAAGVAKLLDDAGDYVAGTPIRLVSCWTGACENGFAQQLANILGVRVRGANGIVGVDEGYEGGIKVLRSRLKQSPGDLLDLPPGWYDFLPWIGK